MSNSPRKASIPRIILASRSPARRKLMQELEVPFECHTSNYEEDMKAFTDPKKLAIFLATGKAQTLTAKFPNSLIIGADTFITIGKTKIGKPSTVKEAEKIISAISGKVIHVHSGVAVLKTDSKGRVIKTHTAHVITKLKIKKMSAAEIHHLATQEEALQISGAFSIEGEGGKMVEKITGDYNNVIGLPILKLQTILKNFS